MQSTMNKSRAVLTIGAVERDTGLSKDVLRVWERRYGFPKPDRDVNGERVYANDQVDRLRMIRRLMDAGYRPGKLLAMPTGELEALDQGRAAAMQSVAIPESQQQVLALVKDHDVQGLRQALSQMLIKQGIQQFTADTVAILNRAVGESWIRGELRIFEEHLYTESVLTVMYAALASIPRQYAEPRILMTTFPNEQHGLALLMAEALLASEGAATISLGCQLPIPELIAAATAHRAQIVCLAFSSAYPVKQAVAGLRTLRESLPPDVAIWVGGELSRRMRRDVPSIVALSNLSDLLTTLRSWRAARFASTEAAAVIQALSQEL